MRGRLATAAYLGDRSHFYVTVEGREKPVAVAAQEIDASASAQMERDLPVWLSWAEEAVILLPRG